MAKQKKPGGFLDKRLIDEGDRLVLRELRELKDAAEAGNLNRVISWAIGMGPVLARLHDVFQALESNRIDISKQSIAALERERRKREE